MTLYSGKLGLGPSIFGMDWDQSSCREITLSGGPGTVEVDIHPMHARDYMIECETGTDGHIILPDLSSMPQQLGLVHRLINIGSPLTHTSFELFDQWGTSYGLVSLTQLVFVFATVETVKGVNPGGPTFSVYQRGAQARTTYA